MNKLIIICNPVTNFVLRKSMIQKQFFMNFIPSNAIKQLRIKEGRSVHRPKYDKKKEDSSPNNINSKQLYLYLKKMFKFLFYVFYSCFEILLTRNTELYSLWIIWWKSFCVFSYENIVIVTYIFVICIWMLLFFIYPYFHYFLRILFTL